MATFITRVELHDASAGDYTKLHEEMEKQGFSRKIKAGNGTLYHLPTAEYYYEGTVDRSDLLAKAQMAAKVVGKTAGIIVSQTTVSTWNGLKVV